MKCKSWFLKCVNVLGNFLECNLFLGVVLIITYNFAEDIKLIRNPLSRHRFSNVQSTFLWPAQKFVCISTRMKKMAMRNEFFFDIFLGNFQSKNHKTTNQFYTACWFLYYQFSVCIHKCVLLPTCEKYINNDTAAGVYVFVFLLACLLTLIIFFTAFCLPSRFTLCRRNCKFSTRNKQTKKVGFINLFIY